MQNNISEETATITTKKYSQQVRENVLEVSNSPRLDYLLKLTGRTRRASAKKLLWRIC